MHQTEQMFTHCILKTTKRVHKIQSDQHFNLEVLTCDRKDYRSSLPLVSHETRYNQFDIAKLRLNKHFLLDVMWLLLFLLLPSRRRGLLFGK